jgi:hypothetical protein
LNDSLAKFSRILAGGALLAFLCAPAYALDVGASVGGASAGASIGGGNGGRAGASVGGASASASIGGGSGVSASIGGPADTGATASIGGGTGVNANVNAGPAGVTIGTGTPGAPGTPGTPGVSNPGLSGVVAGMLDKQLARTKKRCAQVLGSGAQLDADLVALCKLVQMASR